MRTAAIALTCLVALAGCGVSDDRDPARQVALRFYADVHGRDGAAACGRLAPPTAEALERTQELPCERAVVALDLAGSAVAEVEVFETNAAVSFREGEVAYVDRRSGGWKVSAAGCRPAPSGPAECELEG
jgi:uncharacterized protein YceK